MRDLSRIFHKCFVIANSRPPSPPQSIETADDVIRRVNADDRQHAQRQYNDLMEA